MTGLRCEPMQSGSRGNYASLLHYPAYEGPQQYLVNEYTKGKQKKYNEGMKKEVCEQESQSLMFVE